MVGSDPMEKRDDERPRAPTPRSHLDLALSAQLVVAWAGETGEERRLGWWRSDLVSEFGGYDLFMRLLPDTWEWAALEGAREAARRLDAELRASDHDPDRLLSLYRLGFEIDERIETRLSELKREGSAPTEALPGLLDLISDNWQPDRFLAWVASHGEATYSVAPAGRLVKGDVKGEPPDALDARVRCLVAALAPVGDAYPMPHFRRSR
jgi:hypothetical protein